MGWETLLLFSPPVELTLSHGAEKRSFKQKISRSKDWQHFLTALWTQMKQIHLETCVLIFSEYIYMASKLLDDNSPLFYHKLTKLRFTWNLCHGFSVRLTDLQYQYIVLILPNETDILIIPIPIPFWQDMSRSFCRVTEQSTNLPFRYKLVSSAKMWYMHLTTCDWWRWWTRWEPAQCYHFGNTSFIFSITNKTSG